jgi:hypothetical protein
MTRFPSNTLILQDGSGAAFGLLRLAPRTPEKKKWDCIFDIRPSSPQQAARSEVRWLAKRRFKRFGEHRVKMDDDGVVTISLADFRFEFEPDETGGLFTRRPAPPVSAVWDLLAE